MSQLIISKHSNGFYYPSYPDDNKIYTRILPYHYILLQDFIYESKADQIAYRYSDQKFISSIPKGSLYLDISNIDVFADVNDACIDILKIVSKYNRLITGIRHKNIWIASESIYRYHDGSIDIWKITYINNVSIYRVLNMDLFQRVNGVGYKHVRSVPVRISTLWIPCVYSDEKSLVRDLLCHRTPLPLSPQMNYRDMMVICIS